MKTLKQFIFDKMDKNGYVSDDDVAKFLGKDPNWYTVSVYKQQYYRLNFFINTRKTDIFDETTEIYKGHRRYLIRNEALKTFNPNMWDRIPKIYFDYLKEKGVKVFKL